MDGTWSRHRGDDAGDEEEEERLSERRQAIEGKKRTQMREFPSRLITPSIP